MHVPKTRLIIKIFSVLIISLIVFNSTQGILQPFLVTKVDATSDGLKPFKDFSLKDLGSKLKFEFANVTYRTDGLGTDIIGKINLQRLQSNSNFKLESIESTADFQQVKSTGSLSFTVTAISPDQNQILPNNEFVSTNLHSKLYTTNETAEQTFEFDFKAQADLGDFDFSSAIGSKTVENTTSTKAATSALKLDAKYAYLKSTLNSIPDDLPLDKGNFIGSKDTKATNGKYTTSIIGYNDFESGAIGDLRSYLSGQTGVKLADITIQSYEISAVYLMYNLSTSMINALRGALDVVDKLNSVSLNTKYSPLGKIDKTQVILYTSEPLQNFVSTATHSTGTPPVEYTAVDCNFFDPDLLRSCTEGKTYPNYLDDPTARTTTENNWNLFGNGIPDPSVHSEADLISNDAGNLYSSAASANGSYSQDITDEIGGAGSDSMISDPFTNVISILTDFTTQYLMPILFGVIIIFLAIVGYAIYHKRKEMV